MTTPSATMQVAVAQEAAFVRVSGRASFASSVDFKTLMNELRSRGNRRFVLDLTECPIMDSTFLGVLAGFSHRAADAPGGAGTQVELLNANDRVLGLLDNLGVLGLFKVVQCATPAAGQFQSVAATESAKDDVTRTCLEAHLTLMGLNPENAARFKDVTKFLEEDLKRQAGG